MQNATSGITLYINGEDYSQYLIEGQLSDDSAYSTNIITTNGTIKLAGGTEVLDFNKTTFPIGSKVTIYAKLSNGKNGKLPRNTLLVLGSTIDMEEPSITLEVGCSLSFMKAREASYESEIQDLVTTFIPTDIKESFVVEEFTLSVLDSLLAVAGLVIFQNKDGSIQKANKFGGSVYSSADSAKLVSFDKFTSIDIQSIGDAIEDLPSKVIAKANVEIPADVETEDDDDETEDGKPPPFGLTIVQRTILVPTVNIISSQEVINKERFFVENLPESPEAAFELVPGCGSVSDPESGEPNPYGYTCIGEAELVEKEMQETVYRGTFTSYEGPGNQVDYEYDFEYCSAATYANGVMNALANAVVNGINGEAERSRAYCSKVNQSYTQRDDFAERPQTLNYYYNVDPDGNSTLTHTELSEQTLLNQNAQKYYACVGEQYLKAAKGVADGAEAMTKRYGAVGQLDEFLKKEGYSNFNVTYYEYGPGDELVRKITRNFLHHAAADAVVTATETMKPDYALLQGRLNYEYATGDLDVDKPFRNRTFGYQTFSQITAGSTLVSSHNEDKYKYPSVNCAGGGSCMNVFLAQETVATYTYYSLYVKEVISVTDFQNPINNYVQTNYSSTGSKNPAEPDRIEIQRDADGNIYSTNVETKTQELAGISSIDIKGDSVQLSSSWLGTPVPQPKEISLPLEFGPLVQKYNSQGDPINYNYTYELQKYQQILQDYAQNEALKIAADNTGFRITEIGTRAELFGYYPYYPIALNVSSLGKRYGLKAATSSWVFNKDNVLCSIDCFRTSEIVSSIDQDEISPYIYTSFIKTETAVVLDLAFFNLPATTASIEIVSLPQTGTLTVGGNAVSVGDNITVAQITANQVVYTPAGAGTTQISISFTSLDANGNEIGSGDNIYPEDDDQYDILDIYFADAGEFTNNTTNGGQPADAGNFNTGTRPGGNYPLNGGDFDTGTEVVIQEPLPNDPSENGEDNVEDDYGTQVEDEDGNLIDTDTLPGPDGDDEGLLEIDLTLQFKTLGLLRITSELVLQLGWDYGYIILSKGTDIDNGTITTPISYDLDFGAIDNIIDPALASSVS